jgi:CBS domain-containing protein
MAITLTQRATATIEALTAEDIMERDCLVFPQHMHLRDAARMLFRRQSQMAAVADNNGRCVGVLRVADVFSWIEDGCPDSVVGAGMICPFQSRARLRSGVDVDICSRTHGTCRFQVQHPTTVGRHTDVCVRPTTEQSPFRPTAPYLAADFVRITPQTRLPEMVRHIVDRGADGLVVIDDFDRPAGIVSATDILNAIHDHIRASVRRRVERLAGRKPE